jgi:hypothetical protein
MSCPYILLELALIFLFFSLLPAKDNPILVLPIKPMGTAATVEEGGVDLLKLTQALEKELANTGKLQVADRDKALSTRKLQDLAATVDYSSYDASLLGMEARVPVIVMGRVRFLGDRAWLQVGFFDAEAQQTIKEAAGYYSKKELMTKAVIDITRQLLEMKDAKTDSLKALKPQNAGRYRHIQWFVVGVLGTSAIFLLDKYALQKDEKPVVKKSTAVDVEW